MQIDLQPASARDRDTILELLTVNHLPLDGLVDHLGTAIVARSGENVVGCAALELFSDGALLRSVAVRADVRGCGLGQQLAQAALDKAAELGVRSVYLLTTTAEHFFPRFGFKVIEREQVPMSVRQSLEFSSALSVICNCYAFGIVRNIKVAPSY
jgi:amino-acid N-acetyltransferase